MTTTTDALGVLAANKSAEVELVGVKYVGNKKRKIDNVLHTSRSWAPGETLQVPKDHAEIYCRFKGVWTQSDGSSAKADAAADDDVAPSSEPGNLTADDVAKYSVRKLDAVLGELPDELIDQVLNIELAKESPRTSFTGRLNDEISRRVGKDS